MPELLLFGIIYIKSRYRKKKIVYTLVKQEIFEKYLIKNTSKSKKINLNMWTISKKRV